MYYQLPRPKHEDNFEELVRRVSPLIFKELATAEHYGRKGQAQFGVDHYFSGLQMAIQAKNVQSFSASEAFSEVGKTVDFSNPISEYHIFIACDRSTHLSDEIWRMSNARVAQGLFPVKLVGWQDIEMQINSHPMLKEWYLGLPGIQSAVDVAVNRVMATQYEAALPENVAKNLVAQYIPIELAIDFLLSWDFASNRVPQDWYDRFRYVHDALQDVQMYSRFQSAGVDPQGVSSFNLQYPGWAQSYPYLADFGVVLGVFVSAISNCASSDQFADGAYMSAYGPWQAPIYGAYGGTIGWSDNARRLAKYLFDHFYTGSKDYRSYGLYPVYRPSPLL
ncbi:hypothetical protein GVN15_16760 [Pseudomonas putida]|uniref:hypothetical protein n=1 Tax=Pseudomonas putida TaxID=303 RepID=UPI0013771751|nr:hypothetical protein [Pseudomonas putida]NBA82295.1 hypothetical protein [Pseudomonas putida]